ncbi:hypothetical protein [Bacillus cereus]|nr:hypothetical protein bcere0022_9270 [Bacillus cereus Rock3-44]
MYEMKKLDQLYYNCTVLGGIVCPIFYIVSVYNGIYKKKEV